MTRYCRRRCILILVVLLELFVWFYPGAISASRPFGASGRADQPAPTDGVAVELALSKVASWGLPGGKIFVEVKLTNHSPRGAGIYIELVDAAGIVVPGYIFLEPDQTKTQRLRVMPAGGDRKGLPRVIPVFFRGEHPQMNVEPDLIEITARTVPLPEVLGAWLALWSQRLGYPALLVGSAAVFLAAAGAVLYRLLVQPAAGLRGSLYYRKNGHREIGGAGGREHNGDAYILDEARLREIMLADHVHKGAVVISMGAAGEAESHVILLKASGIPYTITLAPLRRSSLPFFLQGWLALVKKPGGAALEIECSRPGIIEMGGAVYSRALLEPGAEFTSGGYRFQYSLPAAPVKGQRGVDLLLEKGMNTWQRSE